MEGQGVSGHGTPTGHLPPAALATGPQSTNDSAAGTWGACRDPWHVPGGGRPQQWPWQQVMALLAVTLVPAQVSPPAAQDAQKGPNSCWGGAGSTSWHPWGAGGCGMSPCPPPGPCSPVPAAPRWGRDPAGLRLREQGNRRKNGESEKAAGLHGNPGRPRAAAATWDGDGPQVLLVPP